MRFRKEKRFEEYCPYFLLKNYAWLLVTSFFFFGYSASAQLTVNATPTNETCPGNGTLTLSVQNADPNVPVNYKVYLLPNTSTAIFNSSGTTVTNLQDGTYLVVATQVINGSPVQDDIEVTIEDETVPLTYTITSDNALCGPDGTIFVTVNTGTAVSYEILAGPVTKPPQPSATLTNIPAGVYQVRVTDNCGTGIVVTHTVFSDAPILVIGPSSLPDIMLPACDLITVGHTFTAGDDIELQFPMDVVFTVYPPDGSPAIVFTQTVTADSDGLDALTVIPFYYDTDYYYDLQVTDPCGVVHNMDHNLVRAALVASGGYGDAGCPGKFLQISVLKYVAPYTITFTSVPEGFDPEVFNVQHPGPFYIEVTNYGSEADEIAVPYGTYEFSVTDACGRTSDGMVEIEEPEEIFPIASPQNATCLAALGGVIILIPGFPIVAGQITIGPGEYSDTYPVDVTSYINDDDEIEMQDLLPPGSYTAVIVDECGNEYTVPFAIVVSTINISPGGRPDCTTGKSSARISTAAMPLTSVIITAAPAAFSNIHPLPYDASYNIGVAGDSFYMNDLPPGSYTYKVADNCSSDVVISHVLTGYSVSGSEYEMTRHCGSFDLWVNHTSTAVAFATLWLQKKIGPDAWGHPETNEPYVEGEVPDDDTGLELINNQEVYSLDYTGEFRIIKSYASYGTGDTTDTIPELHYCFEVLFDGIEFYDDLSLDNIVSLTCSGNIADVQVNVIGASPINYTIITKDGDPFVIENGENNIFTGLEAAEYEVYFEDPCGNFITQLFNVADLPSLVSAGSASNLEACDQDGNGLELFDLSLQTSDILEGQDPDGFVVTYHASEEDAISGENPLPENYNAPTITIYARVVNNLNTACHALTSFDITVRPKPVLNMETLYSMCEGDHVIITADPGFDHYAWTGPATGINQSIVAYAPGNYTLVATDDYGCTVEKTVVVATSAAPHISFIEISDWTDTENTITVLVDPSPSSGNFEYSLDGETYYTSNVFTNLPTGPYTVYVRDLYGCGMDDEDVFLLTYPKYFTPNGDGTNDFWRIKFSAMEPDLVVYIYDRYGKLVSSFDADSPGWDGTLNGERLPATDYWFVVKRQDGNEYKGHFSMIR